MKVYELMPSPDKCVSFELYQSHNVPDKSGCYVLSLPDDTILYIGQSTNIADRLSQHCNNPPKPESDLSKKISRFHYMLFAENEIEIMENIWIDQYKAKEGGKLPPLNSISPPNS